MIKAVTKGVNSLVTKHKCLIPFYPLIWIIAWAMVSDILSMLETQEKFDAKVKASLMRIRKSENEQ